MNKELLRWIIPAISLFAVILLTSVVWGAENGSIDSSDKAIARAQKFLDSVACPASGSARVKEPKDNTGRLTEWIVIFDNARLSIDSISGNITAFLRRGSFVGRTQDVIKINEQQAAALAITYFKDAGFTTTVDKITENKTKTYSNNAGSTVWRVTVKRIYHGYGFISGDALLADLDPSDGKLIGVSCRLSSPEPTSIKLVLKEQDGIDVAKRAIISMGYETGNFISASTIIVQPNGEWNGINDERISRLAWAIRFDKPWRKNRCLDRCREWRRSRWMHTRSLNIPLNKDKHATFH